MVRLLSIASGFLPLVHGLQVRVGPALRGGDNEPQISGSHGEQSEANHVTNVASQVPVGVLESIPEEPAWVDLESKGGGEIFVSEHNQPGGEFVTSWPVAVHQWLSATFFTRGTGIPDLIVTYLPHQGPPLVTTTGCLRHNVVPSEFHAVERLPRRCPSCNSNVWNVFHLAELPLSYLHLVNRPRFLPPHMMRIIGDPKLVGWHEWLNTHLFPAGTGITDIVISYLPEAELRFLKITIVNRAMEQKSTGGPGDDQPIFINLPARCNIWHVRQWLIQSGHLRSGLSPAQQQFLVKIYLAIDDFRRVYDREQLSRHLVDPDGYQHIMVVIDTES